MVSVPGAGRQPARPCPRSSSEQERQRPVEELCLEILELGRADARIDGRARGRRAGHPSWPTGSRTMFDPPRAAWPESSSAVRSGSRPRSISTTATSNSPERNRPRTSSTGGYALSVALTPRPLPGRHDLLGCGMRAPGSSPRRQSRPRSGAVPRRRSRLPAAADLLPARLLERLGGRSPDRGSSVPAPMRRRAARTARWAYRR